MTSRQRGINRIRVVKYKRVSHDEQKLKKNSIIAQDEVLNEYIKKNPNMVLVGDFSDEGVSGTKLQRTELQSLLNMVEAGEVDLILITKLDRWFRNVKFYYKVQEILDRHDVAWKTVLEEYDTTTASGNLNINIALTLAQHETDRNSDRIRVVFDSKVKHKQAITGALPFGFTTTDGNGARMVVKNKNQEHIVYDFIDQVKNTHSIRASMFYINEKYDLTLSYNRGYKLLKNTMLYGRYHDIDDYCEAYITKEEFDEIQRITSRNIKKRETNRVYIFSGLLICPVCGQRLAGSIKRTYKSYGTYEYQLYRCNGHRKSHVCDYKKTISQNLLERQLLAEVMPQLDRLIVDAQIQEANTKTPKINKTAIRDEMDRLNKMYQKGRIKEEDYDRQYDELEKKLYQKEEPKKDYAKIKEVLNTSLGSLYETFSDKEKQIFWRSIIDYIEFDGRKKTIIHFL